MRDAVDELQYATGPVTSYWGARRAADGHPAPFHVQGVEIGNEDFFDTSGSYQQRHAAFYDALHAAYPNLRFIATTQVTSRPYDLIDDHFYAPPAWFEANSHHYDSYPRTSPKVFVGEDASQSGVPTPDISASANAGSPLRTLATRDSRTVYLTVINPSPLPEPTTVRMTGVGTPRTATVTQLRGTGSTDTNTITDPSRVRPVTHTMRGIGSTFRHVVPAYSMTVFRIPAR